MQAYPPSPMAFSLPFSVITIEVRTASVSPFFDWNEAKIFNNDDCSFSYYAFIFMMLSPEKERRFALWSDRILYLCNRNTANWFTDSFNPDFRFILDLFDRLILSHSNSYFSNNIFSTFCRSGTWFDLWNIAYKSNKSTLNNL